MASQNSKSCGEQFLWQAMKTRPRSSWLSLVPILQWGVSPNQRCYPWPFLWGTSGSNIDLSVVIWESLSPAVFNLRCDSIAVTKRDLCLPLLWVLFWILVGIFEVLGWTHADHETSFAFVKGLGDLGRGWDLSSFPCVHILSNWVTFFLLSREL